MTRSNVSHPAQRIELTDRQEAVVRLIEKGLTNAEIAERLGVTLDGVKWHVREILGKFGVESREDAVQRWREERSAGRRARHWAGALWGSMAVRWASGVALAGGAGVAGVVTLAAALPAEHKVDEPAAVVVAPTPTATPIPDLATSHGLTLTVEDIQTDDTKTVIGITLEGRQELGRFGNPALDGFPDTLKLLDEHGVQYGLRSYGGEEGKPRYLRLSFEPVPEGTKSLVLHVGRAYFVAPEFEVPEGQRPPDPSATIEGFWRVTIDEIPRDATSQTVVDPAPRLFDDVHIVLDEVLQTEDSVVVRGHVEALPGSPAIRNIAPYATLVTADGTDLVMITGRWGNGPKEDLMEWEFPLVSGPVTLRLQESGPHVLALSPDDIEANIAARGLTGTMAEDFRGAMERWRSAAAARAVSPGQSPVEWELDLP